LHCYKYLDLEKAVEDPGEKKRYNNLLELLTPVAKTYGAEMGTLAVNQGLQVLGGYGYTEDFVLEQLARDVRIMSLYEGTTGIQSQALLGRQILGSDGQSLIAWRKEVDQDVAAAEHLPTLAAYWKQLHTAIDQFQEVTQHLLKIAAQGDIEVFLSDANLYMEAFGILNVGWQWLQQAIVAETALTKAADLGSDDKDFYASKIQTMRFYFHYEMPKLSGLTTRLLDETVFTLFDPNRELLV